MRLDDVLREDPLLGLTLVAGPWDARTVERVTILDGPQLVAGARRGEIAILTRRASRASAGRQLTPLLAEAGRQQVAALALYGLATTSAPAIDAANQARVALLSVAQGRDPAELAFALETILGGDADATLRRLVAALGAVEHAEPAGVASILVAASAALDAEVRYEAERTRQTDAAVLVNGRREGYVGTDAVSSATRIGCRLVADAIARVIGLNQASSGGGWEREEALRALLESSDEGVARAAGRARAADLPVDGRHTVVMLELRDRGGAGSGAGAAWPADVLQLEALRLGREADWSAARVGSTVVLVRMRAASTTVSASAVDAAATLIRRVRPAGQGPEAVLVCGISGEHQGAAGLRTAAAEARVALAQARATGSVNVPVRFNGADPRSLIYEVIGSQTGRSVTAELLEPLERLGERKATPAIQTLKAYLDTWGSLARSGQILHLHPNAVAHRMKRIRSFLPVDLDDPDQRLALQIACRARLEGGGAPHS